MMILSQSSRGQDITGKSKAVLISKSTPAGYFSQTTIPLTEISVLNPENVIGLNIQVNCFKNGKVKKETLAKSDAPSHLKRFHYPLFKIEACKK